MKIITTNEASKLWNITPRRVAMLAAQGRIPGAKYVDNRWLIPSDSEKPFDTRRKSIKTMKLGSYVFPNIIYAICRNYSADDLNSEEKCLYDAYMSYESADFARSAAIAEELLSRTKNIYIQIGAQYILAFLYILLRRFDEAYSCIVHCLDAFTKVEDHKYEISLLMHEFEMYFRNKEWIAKEFTVVPLLQHSDFQVAYCDYLCIVQECARLTSSNVNININPYEAALSYIDKEEYDFLAMQSHFYISLLCANKGDEKAERLHLKRAIDIAVKNNTYSTLAGLACWIPDSFNAVLKDYPIELELKFSNLMELAASSYSEFETFTGGTQFFKNLTSEDYILISYCLRKLSSKMIAEKMGISQSKVKKQLKDLCNRLKVRNKSELVSAYTEAINNTNIIR